MSRAKTLSPKLSSKVAATLARRRAKSLTPERRSQIARQAAQARWRHAKGEVTETSGSLLADAIEHDRRDEAIGWATGGGRTVLTIGDLVAVVEELPRDEQVRLLKHLLAAMPRSDFDRLRKELRRR